MGGGRLHRWEVVVEEEEESSWSDCSCSFLDDPQLFPLHLFPSPEEELDGQKLREKTHMSAGGRKSPLSPSDEGEEAIEEEPKVQEEEEEYPLSLSQSEGGEEALYSSSDEDPEPLVEDEEYIRKRQCKTHLDLMDYYQTSTERAESRSLQDAKNSITSHKPGDWIEAVGGTTAADYNIPDAITLLLVGPRGSGKSSLVNRITTLFRDDTPFSLQRAQPSHSLSATDGSCFLQEYMIPETSRSLCVYDTRSLSTMPSDNFTLLQRWMARGVSHGEMIIRDSDSDATRKRIHTMRRQGLLSPCQKRTINFVIFVVNGISILKSMDGPDKQYLDTIIEAFNYPFLWFKDNKPVVVVTHGDELSLIDRAHVRNHLGELLGIPPTQQIFDIPDTNDSVTAFTILDMLQYSIKHADRNLPFKQDVMLQVERFHKWMMDGLQDFDFKIWLLMLQALLMWLCIFLVFRRDHEN